MDENKENEIKRDDAAGTDASDTSDIDATVDFDEEEGSDDEDIEIGDEFELDENGDIIIPDEEEDGDDAEESDDDGENDNTDADADTLPEDEEDAPTEKDVQGKPKDRPSKKTDIGSEAAAEPVRKEPDAREAELAQMRTKIGALEDQVRDTLARLGVKDTTDVMAGLERLAAEAAEMSPDVYRQQKNERNRAAEARRALQKAKFDERVAADLAAVHAAYPETKSVEEITKLPNFEKFARFRDSGLTPKEAYIAANPDTVRQSVADSTRRQSLHNTKNHLRPVAGKMSKDTSVRMTKAQLAWAREAFPDMSDREILALHRQTSKK